MLEDASLPETAHQRAIIDNYKLIIGQLLIQHYRKKHVNLMGVFSTDWYHKPELNLNSDKNKKIERFSLPKSGIVQMCIKTRAEYFSGACGV